MSLAGEGMAFVGGGGRAALGVGSAEVAGGSDAAWAVSGSLDAMCAVLPSPVGLRETGVLALVGDDESGGVGIRDAALPMPMAGWADATKVVADSLTTLFDEGDGDGGATGAVGAGGG